MVRKIIVDRILTIGNGQGREFIALMGGASLVDTMKLKKPTGEKRVCFVSAVEEKTGEKPATVGWKGENAHVQKSLTVSESADFLAAIAATGDPEAFMKWVDDATAIVHAGGIVRILFPSTVKGQDAIALVTAPAASVKRVASMFAVKAS